MGKRDRHPETTKFPSARVCSSREPKADFPLAMLMRCETETVEDAAAWILQH